MAQGGKFEHGFFAGFVSSGVGSLHISGNVWVNTAISSSVGGASEAIGGGKFMNGAITGAYTYLINHAAHLVNSTGETGGPSEDAASQGDTDPYQSGHGETIFTMDEFLNANKGLTRSEIINQRQDRSKTFLDSQPGGPNMRYVRNPHDGRVLVMRHMLVIGKQPAILGNLLEVFQWSTGQASGMDLQDFYSNGVGHQFYMQYSGAQNLFYPSTFTDQMRSFFYRPRVIYNW